MNVDVLSRWLSRVTVPGRRLLAAGLGLVLVVGLGVVVIELSAPPWSPPDALSLGEPAEGRDGKVRPRQENPLAVAGAPDVVWPAAGRVELLATGRQQLVDVGGLPVTVSTDGAARSVSLELLDRSTAISSGVAGLLLEVAGGGGDLDLSVGYESFAAGYGGDYGARLKVYEMPRCGSPETAGCGGEARPLRSENDTEQRSVSTSVPVDPSGTVIALMADEDSSQGTYEATALSPSSSWTAGGSSGAFSWSYPITTPPVPGGLGPSIEVGYSSQTVDGRTAMTNNQGSWVGEGFSYEPGYIERRYKPCSEDGHSSKGDQCWAWNNATIMLNGVSGELVKDGGTWRIESDSGAMVERLTGAVNGDDNGEYWRVTTTDGTRYVFGRHRLPGWSSGDAVTNSAWTVPVFGDDSGEPCHGATFADSWCQQAWRWNLDYVVDPRGNVMSYFYGKETNYYARNADTTVNGTSYTRGGYLKRIEYGQRDSTIYDVAAPARIVFDVAERCLPDGGVTCAAGELDDSTASYWPDVPWDRNCAAGTQCEASQTSPSFWTRKRLITITTEVYVGSGYDPVDSWELGHSFVSNADLSRSLWLESVTRTGMAGGGPDVSLPATTLLPVQRPNRVDEIGDNISPLIRPRLATVYTDAGGQIDVTYSGEDCAPGDTPSPSSNTRRCFPVRWQPSSAPDTITDWFHKYVVSEVVVSDRVGESDDQVTRYEYLGGAAWRHAEPDGISDEDNLTWGQWRGYETVRVIGAPATTLATRTDYTYFRGMHGDDNGSGGTRNVTVTDSTGGSHTDRDEFAGRRLERIIFNGSSVVSKAITTQWRHVTATASHSWGDQEAAFVRPNVTRRLVALAAGGWRETKLDHAYDTTYGRVTETDDLGDVSDPGDDRCSRTWYADNISAHMLAYPSREEMVAVDCGTTPDRATDVVSDVRTFYDGGGFDQEPTAGLATTAQELAAHDGTTASYVSVAETGYDNYGRVISLTDAEEHETLTSYTESHGLTVGTTITNVLGHTRAETIDPARGQPTESLDANGQRTSLSYDGLGRLAGVWLPNRTKASGYSPNMRFEYRIPGDGPPTVITETLNNDAVTYQATYQLFDGWLRPRQTQAPGPGDGRLVTDMFYDELGRAYKANDLYWAAGVPSDTLLVVADGEVNGQVVTVFDRAGRVTDEVFQVAGQEKWRTIIGYGGDRVHTTPPDGGVATTVINDARDRTVELRQYHGGTPTGGFDATGYEYTPRDELATVTDPAGNTWTYEYDQRGRKTESTDPDAGTTTYAYNDLNQLLSSTDARGVTISHTYDELGRSTATYEGDPGTGTMLAQWYWDLFQNGQLGGHRTYYDDLTVSVAIQVRDYLYRPLQTRYMLSGTRAGQLAGLYDRGITYNTDHTVGGTSYPAAGGLPVAGAVYTYDDLRRPVTVYDAVTYASDIDYYPTGQLAQVGMFAGATDSWRSFEYEKGSSRLTRAFTMVEGVTGTVADTAYRYDDAGNVLSIIDDPGVAGGQRDAQCFTYDHLRRLSTAWSSAAPGEGDTACAGDPTTTGVGGAAAYWHDYGFDLVGNRTSRTIHATGAPGSPPSDVDTSYTYPAPGGDQPHTLLEDTSTSSGTQTGHTAYGYDQAGNATTVDRDGTVEVLTWDPLGHLESITAGGEVTEFFYDADGNRILRDGPDGLTAFIPGMELHQPAGTSTVTATRYIDLPGGVTYVETTGEPPQYQISDHHGTGTLSIDPDTGAAEHRRLDPYGNPRGTPPADWIGDLGFVGGTLDLTGYTHLGAREYDPRNGRFISLDPIMDLADPQQMHGYAYANNNPITYADPTGLIWAVDTAGYQTANANANANADDNEVYDTGADPDPSGEGTCYDLGGAGTRCFAGSEFAPDSDEEPIPFQYYAAHYYCGGPVALDVCHVSNMSEDQVMRALAAYLCHYLDECEAEEAYQSQARWKMAEWASWIPYVGVPFSIALAAKSWKEGDYLGAAIDIAGMVPIGKGLKPFKACSFDVDTQVLMADGTTIAISEIQPGDRVWATDPQTGEEGPRTVTAVWVHNDTIIDLELDDNGMAVAIATTENHPFWNHTDQQWQRADALDPGDLLYTPDGTRITITGLDWTTVHTDSAYNLTVADLHTYYVLAGTTPVLVHNEGGDDPSLGGMKKLSDSQAKRIVGDVHEFKQDVVGRGAKISSYDVYIEKSTGNLYLMDKAGRNPIPTYVNKGGTWHPGAGGAVGGC
jgi:RHS repeat-associated protein